MSDAHWNLYPNFKKSEFDCKQTGENQMQHEFMVLLQAIRNDYRKGMVITSGFRSVRHSIEARKGHTTGEHPTGLCCDIACTNSRDRFRLIQLALKHGITRIGIAKTFLHFGISKQHPQLVMWDYS